MPQMGVSVAEGTVVAWRVEIGDRIEADATICEISTDKIDTEVPAPVSGIVAEILAPVDTTVDVGTVLARIATGDGASAPEPASTPEPPAEPQRAPEPPTAEGPPGPEPAPAPAAGQPAAASAPGQLSRIRRQIGEHMKRSLETAATCTTWIEVDMGRVEAARAQLGVTALAFVARASIDALRELPALNAW